MYGEIEEVAESEPQVEETPEQREARLKREQWARRDAEAWAAREQVHRDNGLLKEGETLSRDPDAAAGRCCF